MTDTNSYHHPGQDPSSYGGDDSDSDLDLGELDDSHGPGPQATLAPTEPTKNKKKSLEIRSQVPLRNLRFGGRRDYRRTAAGPDGDHDDLETLVNNSSQPAPAPATNLRTRTDGNTVLPAHLDPPARPSDLLTRLRARLFSGGAHSRLPDDTDGDEAEEHDATSDREIQVGLRQDRRYPSNAVSNAKYTPVSFLPRTLYNEFSFFFNLYFLLVALSQIIKPLRIGMLSTYIAPLAFVLCITLGKEALDDIARRRRDKEANSELYSVLHFDNDIGLRSKRPAQKRKHTANGDVAASASAADDGLPDSVIIERRKVFKNSKDIKVGDVLVMEKNERFPADVIILKSFTQEAASDRTTKDMDAETDLIDAGLEPARVNGELVNETTSSDPSAGGEAFIRTDQLDGETDWKLRLAAPLAQSISVEEFTRLRIVAGKPDRKVNDFVGTLELVAKVKQQYDPHVAKGDEADSEARGVENSPSKKPTSQPLSIDHTAWANTVLASSSTVLAVVIYTGPQTRAALSTSQSRSKTGLLEYEINTLTKILCALTLALSFGLVAIQGFKPHGGMKWYVAIMRFLILFSTIVPISLRVNLDLGKSVYAWFIQRDSGIPETVVRTSTIPSTLR